MQNSCMKPKRLGNLNHVTNKNRSYIADNKSVEYSAKPIAGPTKEIPLLSFVFDGRVPGNVTIILALSHLIQL